MAYYRQFLPIIQAKPGYSLTEREAAGKAVATRRDGAAALSVSLRGARPGVYSVYALTPGGEGVRVGELNVCPKGDGELRVEVSAAWDAASVALVKDGVAAFWGYTGDKPAWQPPPTPAPFAPASLSEAERDMLLKDPAPEPVPEPVSAPAPASEPKPEPKPEPTPKPVYIPEPATQPQPRPPRPPLSALSSLLSDILRPSPPHEASPPVAALFLRGAYMTPFRGDTGTRWARISPGDLLRMGGAFAPLAESALALRCYHTFKHIALGQDEQTGELTIALPDLYTDDKANAAAAPGFTRFRTRSGDAPKEGDYGYWLKRM